MKKEEVIELYDQYVMKTMSPKLVLVKGEGSYVWDADGKKYLDFLAGISVTNLGHAHPAVLRAVREQSERIIHTSNIYYNELQPQLARKLSERSLGGKCFFCNSGAEANEALIKLARLWGHDKGKYEIITLRQSFHGRTLATLTATGQDKVQQGYDPLPSGFVYAQFNDVESCRAAVTDKTAAILLEPVQGEGGILPATPEFMRGIRKLCDEKGILMLCDEVQCGMGRTGYWFAYQAYDVQPDALSTAKALANGIPMGAIAAKPFLSDVFQPGAHATTFGGTPLASAVALAVFNTIDEEHLLENVRKVGAYFEAELKAIAAEFAFIEGVRGRGLMLALALNVQAKPLLELLEQHGLLALNAGEKVVRFLPPLNIGEEQVQEACAIIRKACAELAAASL